MLPDVIRIPGAIDDSIQSFCDDQCMQRSHRALFCVSMFIDSFCAERQDPALGLTSSALLRLVGGRKNFIGPIS
jgi:hypothetical protein